jgi:hypothetical protein
MSAVEQVEVFCDAPNDDVIHACEDLGFHSPWDVRWMHRCEMRNRPEKGGLFGLFRWLVSFWLAQPPDPACTCGQRLPRKSWYRIAQLRRGQLKTYKLGQCPRCFTIFWQRE